jgi:hypothetical protein
MTKNGATDYLRNCFITNDERFKWDPDLYEGSADLHQQGQKQEENSESSVMVTAWHRGLL